MRHLQFAKLAFARFRKQLKERDCLPITLQRLGERAASFSGLARPRPFSNRGINLACLGSVAGEHLRVRLLQVGEFFIDYVRYQPMQFFAATFEQGLIRSVTNKSVLKR